MLVSLWARLQILHVCRATFNAVKMNTPKKKPKNIEAASSSEELGMFAMVTEQGVIQTIGIN